MSKIDLIDNSWVDLVFEGKNQAYGAYRLRKNTGKRNFWSLVTVILAIAAIFLIVIAKVAIENAMPKKVAITTDVELSQLAKKKEAKVERKEPVKVEMEQKVVEKEGSFTITFSLTTVSLVMLVFMFAMVMMMFML